MTPTTLLELLLLGGSTASRGRGRAKIGARLEGTIRHALPFVIIANSEKIWRHHEREKDDKK